MDKNSSSNFLVSPGFVLFFVFLIFKVTGVEPSAHWSWWIVIAPLWMQAVISFLQFAGKFIWFFGTTYIAYLIDKI